MITTIIHWPATPEYWMPSAPFDIERRASFICDSDIPRLCACAFDDSTEEAMDFGGRFNRTWGKVLRVDLCCYAANRPKIADVVWHVGIFGNMKGQSSLDGKVVQLQDSRLSTESFALDVSSFKADDPFSIVVWRACKEAGDTLVGDAMLTHVVATGGDEMTPCEISDEEFARRAGIYRGPK